MSVLPIFFILSCFCFNESTYAMSHARIQPSCYPLPFSGTKRKHSDYEHNQGPSRKSQKCFTHEGTDLSINNPTYATLNATVFIKQKTSCDYLSNIDSAMRTAAFLKLSMCDKIEHKIVMVPVVVSSLSTANPYTLNFSNGFDVALSNGSIVHYDWFPQYLPLDWLSMMTEESPLHLTIQSKIPLRLTLWPVKMASYQSSGKTCCIEKFQTRLQQKYCQFVEDEAKKYYDPMIDD